MSSSLGYGKSLLPHKVTSLEFYYFYMHVRMLHNGSYSPVENKNDLELDFKVFFFMDLCCSDIVHDESS